MALIPRGITFLYERWHQNALPKSNQVYTHSLPVFIFEMASLIGSRVVGWKPPVTFLHLVTKLVVKLMMPTWESISFFYRKWVCVQSLKFMPQERFLQLVYSDIKCDGLMHRRTHECTQFKTILLCLVTEAGHKTFLHFCWLSLPEIQILIFETGHLSIGSLEIWAFQCNPWI